MSVQQIKITVLRILLVQTQSDLSIVDVPLATLAMAFRVPASP